jgi:hypothetical protein
MKKVFIATILLCTTFIFSDEPSKQTDEDFALLQEAIEIVASMSDNIANLVIQHQIESNTPEITKQECIALIQKMTAFVVTILKKQKLKKNSRKIFICSSENFNQELDHIAQDILYKIKMG